MPTRRAPRSSIGLTAIDLFCGAGGLTEGFRNAGFDVTFALDADRDSCETYKRNHPDTKVECAPIEEWSPAEFASIVGQVDVVLGGPSCQGFSTHGRREKWGDLRLKRNRLWRHMLGVIDEVRPAAFLIENVPGFTLKVDSKNASRRKVDAIEEHFRALGYDVQRRILLAADFGVPQLRRRVFLVGVRDEFVFHFPEGAHLGGWRRDTQEIWETRRLEAGKLRHLTCADAIGDLPLLGATSGNHVTTYPDTQRSSYAVLMREGSRKIFDHESSSSWPTYAPLFQYIPEGGTWRDIPPHLLPDRFRGMRRTDSTNLLGRLDSARPAYTITTQFNNISSGCFIHPLEDRSLTIREGARLQSFPDRYRFVGSISSRCRQIGNAVPPLLAQHLAASLADAIDPTRPARAPRTLASTHSSEPAPPDEATRRRMRSQARADTKPETAIRTALFHRGLRFRKNVKPIRGLRREVDILFGPSKVAVFVDGCFWHGCPEHSRATKSNTRWWADKIAHNKERDTQTTTLLEALGYEVIRVWEHEDPEAAADRIDERVTERR